MTTLLRKTNVTSTVVHRKPFTSEACLYVSFEKSSIIVSPIIPIAFRNTKHQPSSSSPTGTPNYTFSVGS